MWTSGSLALLLTWAACPVSAHRIARDEAPGAEVEKPLALAFRTALPLKFPKP